MALLEATIIPEDVDIIQSIPVSRFGRPDTYGWNLTKHGKYTVKTGYMVETQYTEIEGTYIINGPTTISLQAFVWTIKCPPKIQHFIWQMITGCVAVTKKLNARGIQCDVQCGRCGAEEESINHVIFECPPAFQTWAISKIPSNPDIFPKVSIFSNLQYLFSELPKDGPEGYFPWIIWYLWKARNDKVFKSLDRHPHDIIQLAETEGKIWEDAQIRDEVRYRPVIGPVREPIAHDIWTCQVDGSWKAACRFSGQGWVCFKNDSEELLMGARNTLSSQSPLHAELETLIWAMECMKGNNRLRVRFATDCSDVVKMVSSPEEWPAFAIHLEEFNNIKMQFNHIKIALIPRTSNKKADNLARSVRRLTSPTVFMDSIPPAWIEKHL